MKHQIIVQVVESDRNIYLTIEDGSLVSVNYSQGLGDIDFHFLTANTPKITNYVIKELIRLGDELYSPEFFFPSPYWDEQVKAIDIAIWKFINEENERAEIIESIMLIENEMAKLQNQLTELRNKL